MILSFIPQAENEMSIDELMAKYSNFVDAPMDVDEETDGGERDNFIDILIYAWISIRDDNIHSLKGREPFNSILLCDVIEAFVWDSRIEKRLYYFRYSGQYF